MNYVGCDLHKETTWFYVLDDQGRKVLSQNVTNDQKSLKLFFEKIPRPFTLAVEATYNWYFFVDLAEQYADKVYLANSYELKAFAKRHKKSDKIDARLVATVLFQGYLPKVMIADSYTRQIRELLRCRLTLVQDRSRNVTRLKMILDKLGHIEPRDLCTYKDLDALPITSLSPMYAQVVTNYRDRIKFLCDQISAVNKVIMDLAIHDQDITNLDTIPGVAYFSAALIKTEIIDINRFSHFGQLCAYAGLAPQREMSANKVICGPLNKNRRKLLRWILLEDAMIYINVDEERKKEFEQIKKTKGFSTAKIIFARRLLKIIHRILKERRPYYHDQIQSAVATAL
jgi:transposase